MQSLDTPDAARMSIDCPCGEVDVATHDAPRTTVEVVGMRDDDATREAVDGTRVELRGAEVVVEVPKRSSLFGREPRVRVVVRAPHGSALTFRTASADVVAHGRLGAVSGKTASGHVEIEGAAELRLESASGDLRVREVGGAAALRSASGAVEVRHVAGVLSVNVVSGAVTIGAADAGAALTTVSGGIDVASVGGGDVVLASVSGDLTVGIAAGSRVHVDVTTVSGDLRSDLELGEAPTSGDGPLVHVRGRSVSGDVLIRRAHPVAV